MYKIVKNECPNFSDLEKVMKLPFTGSFVSERTQAIEVCTESCGLVKDSCTAIIGDNIEKKTS